jgi:hypothetical protein
MKLAASRALLDARQAYLAEEIANLPPMSEAQERRWRERRAIVEGELTRISKSKTP